MDWKARYTDTVRALKDHNQVIKGLETELDTFRSEPDSLNTRLQEQQSVASTLASENAALRLRKCSARS